METVHPIIHYHEQLHTSKRHKELIGGRDPKPLERQHIYPVKSPYVSLHGFPDDIGKKENNEEADYFIASEEDIVAVTSVDSI
jgi:hypothetical protein